jgi:hypothetical protein
MVSSIIVFCIGLRMYPKYLINIDIKSKNGSDEIYKS